MKTPKEWSKECIRQFGYGVDPKLVEQIQKDARESLLLEIKKASEDLAVSAEPFDRACMTLRKLLE